MLHTDWGLVFYILGKSALTFILNGVLQYTFHCYATTLGLPLTATLSWLTLGLYMLYCPHFQKSRFPESTWLTIAVLWHSAQSWRSLWFRKICSISNNETVRLVFDKYHIDLSLILDQQWIFFVLQSMSADALATLGAVHHKAWYCL